MRKNIFFILSIVTVISICKAYAALPNRLSTSNDLKLWYDKPAADWMSEALPIGNAYMGAMIFGGINEEHIQINEETLWEGGSGSNNEYSYGNRKDAWKHLADIRQLLADNKFDKAGKLADRELTGTVHTIDTTGGWMSDFGAYQNLGDIFIKIKNDGDISDYYRDLNILNATANVTYKAGNIFHERKYFASYPKRVLAFALNNNSPKGASYEIKCIVPHQNIVRYLKNNILTIRGNIKHNKMQFEVLLKIITDGKISEMNNSIIIEKANNVKIYVTSATDYLNDYPTYRGRDYVSLNQNTFKNIENISYEKLLAEHISDYQSLFNRVSLSLGKVANSHNVPTDNRFEAYSSGTKDPQLEALYFQFGRYLTISATRPGSMPLTLQGKWNNSNMPPWSCDFHTNINEQMLYWPCEVTNLSECQIPLANYIESLQKPGSVSAKEHFGCDGWIVCTMNNEFGFTAPGWNFPWGFYPAGAAWLCQHLWEHFSFSNDTTFLKNKALPIMKAAAMFWDNYLTKDENGYLVSCPSYSPEQGGISKGATMDHEIVWDLFSNFLEGCRILNIEDAFSQKIESDLKALYPLKIGRWGQLQEWKEDIDDSTNHHRHVSHLFALYPGKEISPLKTPELADAAERSLTTRGDDGTGWSIAWKISFWARLLDGDHAYKMLRRILRPMSLANPEHHEEGGSYPNLFCSCPPFQLDGNMGSCAGIAEMLLQSQTGIIQLLPALPKEWNSGSVKGLRARGGFEVDIDWNDGKLIAARVKSLNGKPCKVKYENKVVDLDIKPGNYAVFNSKFEIQNQF